MLEILIFLFLVLIWEIGFFANVKKDEITESFDLLLSGEFTIQERTLLSIKTLPQTEKLKELLCA